MSSFLPLKVNEFHHILHFIYYSMQETRWPLVLIYFHPLFDNLTDLLKTRPDRLK